MMTPQPDTFKILVVDDEQDVLELLNEWFSCVGYEVKTARGGFDALALAKQESFDVIITDLQMPGLSGLHLLAIFKELDPNVEVIFLTGQGTMEDAIEALKEGKAFDFLHKPIKNLKQLNQVIERAVARRHQRVPSAALPKPAPVMPPSCLEALTEREIEIMKLVAEGLDNQEIGDRLFVSGKTIKNYLTRIYEKLGVKSRTQAMSVCRQSGLV